jgi:hypothetical protein
VSVSVIVPVCNGGPAFRRCLEALRAAEPPPLEVIVVSDGSEDGSDRLAESFGVSVLHTPERSGPATARNLGARQAHGDILFFVDADVCIEPAAIGKVARTFAEHPSIAALLGSYDDAPDAPNFLSQYKNLLQCHVHQVAAEEGFTFWGACGAIRREVFESVGGFDEHYRQPCIEDIELGYRLRAAGHRIRLCKDLYVKHLKRWGPVSLFRSDFFCRALPWAELILRSGNFQDDLNISRTNRVKVVLAGLVVLMLALGCWKPIVILAAVPVMLGLVVLDASLLRFFHARRGLLFALRAVPCLWFSYLYSGLAFALALARHHLLKTARRGRSLRQRLPLRFRSKPDGHHANEEHRREDHAGEAKRHVRVGLGPH